jgi:hypothetical protein
LDIIFIINDFEFLVMIDANKIYWYLLPLLAVSGHLSSNAQSISPQLLSSAGSTISTPEMRLSWSLGEGFVGDSRSKAGAAVLTAGFHQGNLQVIPIAAQEQQLVKIAPNPVREILNISAISTDRPSFFAKLVDVQGRILMADFKISGNAEIDMSAYPAGVYFLSIRQPGKPGIQSYQVIKL